MLTKEDRCPSPVECQLAGVQGHSCAPYRSLAASECQVAGIPHAGVQAAPHRTKHPWGWTPGRFLNVVIPSLKYIQCFINLTGDVFAIIPERF